MLQFIYKFALLLFIINAFEAGVYLYENIDCR